MKLFLAIFQKFVDCEITICSASFAIDEYSKNPLRPCPTLLSLGTLNVTTFTRFFLSTY